MLRLFLWFALLSSIASLRQLALSAQGLPAWRSLVRHLGQLRAVAVLPLAAFLVMALRTTRSSTAAMGQPLAQGQATRSVSSIRLR